MDSTLRSPPPHFGGFAFGDNKSYRFHYTQKRHTWQAIRLFPFIRKEKRKQEAKKKTTAE